MALDQWCPEIEKKRAQKTVTNINSSGFFEGYASLFGIADQSNDIVEKGAFSESLKKLPTRPVRMLFQHDPDQLIGRWVEITENQKGLYVKGQLNLDVARAREVHSLMLSGALDGLSIGFKTKKSQRSGKSGARHILNADLWEISVVTFPMLLGARVDHIKAHDHDASFDNQLAANIRAAAQRI